MPPRFTPETINFEPVTETEQRRPIWKFALAISFILLLGVVFISIRIQFFLPPSDFPVNVPITIEEGSSARSVAALMSESGYVRSEIALYLALLWWHNPSDIKASTYVFSSPLDAKEIALELTQGHFDTDLIRLTLIEGERATYIAKTAAQVLPNFDPDTFLVLAIPYEGKLFPDTYFVPKDFTAEDLFNLLTSTHEEKISALSSEISGHSLSLEEILVLASIIEREANTEESMRLVSGILQNRMDIGMALQVDASMEYILDKPLSELTPEDLDIDSPYNTYLYRGLPPTPIGNPGLIAIEAVLDPTPSKYFYYITGTDGNFYYAETFDEHRLNIARYLR